MLKNQQGNIVEVLLAMLLLSMAAFAFVGASAYANIRTVQGKAKNIAYDEALKISETIKSFSDVSYSFNGDNVLTGNNDICTSDTMSCSSQDRINYELYRWTQGAYWKNFGVANLYGVVCRDSTPKDGTNPLSGNTITYANAACDGAGPIIVKVFWTAAIPASKWTPYSSNPSIYLEVME